MFRKLHRDYLSLTRGERRGMQILSLFAIILLVFRVILPQLIPPAEADLTLAEKEFIAFQDSLIQLSSYKPGGSLKYPLHSGTSMEGRNSSPWKKPNHPETSILPEPFPFDPNKATITELARLGIPMWTARTLINYREAGGVFKKDSDLLRVYGLEPEVYTQLKEYILIDTSGFKSGMTRPFELNQADSVQLISVYGIGPVFAQRIISYRELLGGFHSPYQLMEVYGFSPTQYQEIMQRSFLDSSYLRKIDLNRVDVGDLAEHPYLDRYQAESIIYYREIQGSFESGNELLENSLLPDSVFLRIRPYLVAGR